MGYYMRFVGTDDEPFSTKNMQEAFSAAGSGYDVQVDETAGTILHQGATIAHVEINTPGDGMFDEEREELIEFAAEAGGDSSARTRVVTTLRRATFLVAAQVLFGTGDTDATLGRLDPLWAWLFRHRHGLLQADGEGYYDAEGLILEVE